jgi:hypothetical protein
MRRYYQCDRGESFIFCDPKGHQGVSLVDTPRTSLAIEMETFFDIWKNQVLILSWTKHHHGECRSV